MLLKIGTIYDPDYKILNALKETDQLFKEYNIPCIITSMRDREHSAGSKHYAGLAYDVRTKHIPQDIYKSLLTEAKTRLTANAYTLIEHETHWHIEK